MEKTTSTHLLPALLTDHGGASVRSCYQWWDYRELVATRPARRQIMLVVAVAFFAFFAQWGGKNVISYFLVSRLIALSRNVADRL